MMTNLPERRPEASGPGWQEHFVNEQQASLSSSVGAAITDSFSYVTIPNFGSLTECLALQNAALAAQEQAHDDGTGMNNKSNHHPHVMGASHVNFNCTRYSVQGHLVAKAPQTQTAHAAFLQRLLVLLETDEDLYHVFDKSHLQTHYTAKWYAEPDEQGTMIPEPKVNLYQQGGYFTQHVDGMHLTLLVVLNDSFEGGGTAFFIDKDEHAEDSTTARRTPICVARPPAGTALIWGGSLSHMALPVTKGMRAVYVGSFDLE